MLCPDCYKEVSVGPRCKSCAIKRMVQQRRENPVGKYLDYQINQQLVKVSGKLEQALKYINKMVKNPTIQQFKDIASYFHVDWIALKDNYARIFRK